MKIVKGVFGSRERYFFVVQQTPQHLSDFDVEEVRSVKALSRVQGAHGCSGTGRREPAYGPANGCAGSPIDCMRIKRAVGLCLSLSKGMTPLASSARPARSPR